MLKEKIINKIIEIEGGFVDDPADSGGATRYGITEQVARNAGYKGDMRELPRSFAFEIYATTYWYGVRAPQLLAISEDIAAEVVDTAVNTGSSRASRILQRAINVLDGAGLKVDGILGPSTLGYLEAYVEQRGADTLLKALNVLQGAFYIELVEKRSKDRRFIHGWLDHRVNIR